MKRLQFLLVLVLIASGCADKNTFKVTGVVNGEKGKQIYINRVDINTPVMLDSSKISSRGNFSFKVKAAGPEFYQVGFDAANFITLLAEPGEKINLNFSGKNLFANYTVTGSVGSEKIRTLDLTLADTKRKLDSLRTVYQKASSEPGFDKKGPAIEEEYGNIIKEQRKKNIGFIIENINSLAAIKALYQKISDEMYVLYEPRDLQYLKIVTDSLTKHYPDSRQVQALARDFGNEMSQIYQNQIAQMAKDLPVATLDPSLADINGKRISLSSLRGKYVLLTFWSVKSSACVEENLQLKNYYQLYSRKGFEIYQINLDENMEEWKTAVRFDELPWISTREDDPLDPKNAVLFNVKTLPANYLFDREGKIIGSNLHGRALQIRLEQLFSK